MRDRLAAVWRLLGTEHGWSRVWVSLGMAITMAGGGLIYYTTQDGEPPAGTAHFWIDTTGGTCVRQSPTDGYDNDGTECDSMGEAYTAATSGDTVRIVAGTYSGETLSGRSKTITYRADGGTVNINTVLLLENFSNGSFYGPFVIDTPSLIQDLKVWCSSNVDFHDVTGKTFYITDGSQDIQLYGGSWGDYGTDVASNYGDSAISGYDGGVDCTLSPADGWVRDVLVDGVRFHDIYWEPLGYAAHPDCLETYGMTDGVTVRNSVFERCGFTFIGWYTDFAANYNLLVENNFMRAIYDDVSNTHLQIGDGGGGIGQGEYECSAVFRYNTVDTSVGVATDSQPLINCDDEEVYGNIFTDGPSPSNCEVSSYWSYNVFETDNGGCNSNTQVGALGWVNRSADADDVTIDYHLSSGSIASGAGHPTQYPATDFEGTSRPQDTNADAGYDERDD